MSAKQASLSNWMTVKKKGKDDAQIARDRNKALAARKQANSKTKKPAAKSTFASLKKKQQPPPAKKKKRNAIDSGSESDYFDDGSDDDDSMEKFVVDDDDVSVEEYGSSEEEDELMVVKQKKKRGKAAPPAAAARKRRTPAAVKWHNPNSDDEEEYDEAIEEEDDDDEDEKSHFDGSSSNSDSDDDKVTSSFFPPSKARTSRPSKALARAGIAAKTRPNAALSVPALKAPALQVVTKRKLKRPAAPKTKVISLDDDDSLDNLSSPSPVVQRTKKAPSKNKVNVLEDSDTNDDLTPIKPKRRLVQKQGIRKNSNTRVNEWSDDSPEKDLMEQDDDDDDDGQPGNGGGGGGVKRSSSLVDSSEDDDDDEKIDDLFGDGNGKPRGNKTLSKKKSKTKVAATKKQKRLAEVELGESEEDDVDIQKAMRRSLGENVSDTEEHVITNPESDDDDAVVMRLGIKQSLKEAKKQQKKMAKSKHQQEEEEKPELRDAQLDETSDEEEGDRDGDMGDEYDAEKESASSVLETAEQLSAQVIRAMTDWMGSKDGSNSTSGLIVDGALAMSSMKTGGEDDNKEGGEVSETTDSSRHQWISQEEMRRICPGVTLSDYQLVGVNWMALLHGMKCHIDDRDANVNGVLADEMGLGKTVQTIAFLAWLRSRSKTITLDGDDRTQSNVSDGEPSGPHLIIVPVSVLSNWMREFETFCPDLNVVKFHGSQNEREEIKEHLRQYLGPKNRRKGNLDVILAPVTYFQKDKSPDRVFLHKFDFDYLVVDEAHLLRNSQSIRYKELNKVRTRHRLLLTGTPVQNTPQELMNMLCFLMPLFSRGTTNKWDEDGAVVSIGDRMLQHFVDEKRGSEGDAYAYKKLKHLFAPFVLRRKKDDVLGQLIPPKEQVVEFVDLDQTARKTYDSIVAAHINKSGNKLTGAIGEHLFTNLRKAAHHPLLLRTRHNTPKEVEHLVHYFHQYGAFKGEGSTKERVAEEVAKYNDFTIHLIALELIDERPFRREELGRYILDTEDLFSSAKFARLRTLIPKLISEGHRILIFSVWTSCLDLLGCLVEHLGLQFLRMDGSCPSAERQGLIDQFNNNPSYSIFLLSTNACGIGINLTAADTCIIHDLDFNPFNDLQAEARCHRIGQKKKVTVIKMVAKDTVDADIYDMQERKSKMNAAIMDSKESAKEKKELAKKAMDRYLALPTGGKKNGIDQYLSTTNKENVGDMEVEVDIL